MLFFLTSRVFLSCGHDIYCSNHNQYRLGKFKFIDQIPCYLHDVSMQNVHFLHNFVPIKTNAKTDKNNPIMDIKIITVKLANIDVV